MKNAACISNEYLFTSIEASALHKTTGHMHGRKDVQLVCRVHVLAVIVSIVHYCKHNREVYTTAKT